jgi:hypothetical protein
MKYIVIAALVILSIIAGQVCAQDPEELEKIRYLIASVEDLKGVKFIRNGSEFDGDTAADHLRTKLAMAGDKVRTAADFIRLCASKSDMSGKPYKIKFADGRTIEAEIYFKNKLKTYVSGRKKN